MSISLHKTLKLKSFYPFSQKFIESQKFGNFQMIYNLQQWSLKKNVYARTVTYGKLSICTTGLRGGTCTFYEECQGCWRGGEGMGKYVIWQSLMKVAKFKKISEKA
jgi:hypothetical protein